MFFVLFFANSAIAATKTDASIVKNIANSKRIIKKEKCMTCHIAKIGNFASIITINNDKSYIMLLYNKISVSKTIKYLKTLKSFKRLKKLKSKKMRGCGY